MRHNSALQLDFNLTEDFIMLKTQIKRIIDGIEGYSKQQIKYELTEVLQVLNEVY